MIMLDKNFIEYQNVKVGFGSFKLPPVLIGTMFYQGQRLIDNNDITKFDKEKALKRIEKQVQLSNQYKIPALIEISADTPDAMTSYLDFYLDNFKPPFVLGGTLDARISGVAYLYDQGYKSEDFIYNAISNLKNQKEIELFKKYEIQTAIILVLASPNMTSTQRFSHITDKTQPNNVSLFEGLKELGVKYIWVDGGVVNLESLVHILETQKMISTALKVPVGTAPNLFLFKYSSPRLNLKFHTRYRRSSIMFIASWYSNFIFYGPIEDATECFASTAQSFEFKRICEEKNVNLLD
jgi:tetrahydromethanopterin S-methyltransferase subunit H